MKKRVLLGMSGGIDSSVAAILLQEQGYEVIGITFLFSGDEDANKNMLDDAKKLAVTLNIKHITSDIRVEFRETVIAEFIAQYKKGKTPFPCAICNPQLKFFYLEKYAKDEKCDFIATGHYAQIKLFNGKKYIFEGVDPDKDQSFFLWGLNKDLVSKLIFPLGGYTKLKIRSIAKERGFVRLSEKKDSLGICFIEGNNYREFLKNEGLISEPGNFVNDKGVVLGKHNGITNYTIGQRRGLGINLNFPVFVSEIRLDANEIVLGKYEDLYRSKIVIYNYQFVDNKDIKSDLMYNVKIRYRLQLTPCRIDILNESRAVVELLNSEAMIANGQTAVFYDGDRLLGGGFIESSE